jgi:hypothetical protein
MGAGESPAPVHRTREVTVLPILSGVTYSHGLDIIFAYLSLGTLRERTQFL